MMACGSNGCFRASETEDEEGPSGFRMVGRPATAGVASSIRLQCHQLRTVLERLPHENAFPGGRAIHFPVCTMAMQRHSLAVSAERLSFKGRRALQWPEEFTGMFRL